MDDTVTTLVGKMAENAYMNKSIPNWMQKIKEMPKGRNPQRKIYQNDRTLLRVVRTRASFPNILKRFWDSPGGTW